MKICSYPCSASVSSSETSKNWVGLAKARFPLPEFTARVHGPSWRSAVWPAPSGQRRISLKAHTYTTKFVYQTHSMKPFRKYTVTVPHHPSYRLHWLWTARWFFRFIVFFPYNWLSSVFDSHVKPVIIVLVNWITTRLVLNFYSIY